MKIAFGYGTGVQEAEVPDGNLQDVLLPNPVIQGLTGEAEVRRALAAPIGADRLRKLARPGESVVIVTSDITRPMPTPLVMPPLLDELYGAGVRPKDITLVFALGSHRPHTREEQRKLAGERAYAEVRCIDSQPARCVRLGYTSRGTPVDIDSVVVHADRRICLGNIEYHYFAGYSGGAKALMPGVSTREAIQHNHSMMVLPEACAGNLKQNPVRQDLEEAANMVGIDFLLNVVVDERKQIVRAVAGDVRLAHREGCMFLDGLYRTAISKRADIVLVSQGGAPKDLNLYQTQKALDNARHAVRQGGVIILIGSCKEGLGEQVFEEWITSAVTADSMIERIANHFELGGHKAAAIAMVLRQADIYLVSELPEAFVRSIFLQPFPSAQAALDAAFAKLGRDANVLAMPYGGSTLPFMESGS
ncbi:MAG: nickel-dependent lactate racemase [Clostridia bacterium]|nr:nickel-dependent lactate racemase [Clostridia bacterium]